MTDKSSCRDPAQCDTKIRLEQSRKILINLRKVILCALKVRSSSGVMRQLIAKSHRQLRCLAPSPCHCGDRRRVASIRSARRGQVQVRHQSSPRAALPSSCVFSQAVGERELGEVWVRQAWCEDIPRARKGQDTTAPVVRCNGGLISLRVRFENSSLPQRGKEAEGAENGFQLCSFAPLRQKRMALQCSNGTAFGAPSNEA